MVPMASIQRSYHLMEFTYDKDSDAAYITFSAKAVGELSTDGGWPFNVDVDEAGSVIGLDNMRAAYLAALMRP